MKRERSCSAHSTLLLWLPAVSLSCTQKKEKAKNKEFLANNRKTLSSKNVSVVLSCPVLSFISLPFSFSVSASHNISHSPIKQFSFTFFFHIILYTVETSHKNTQHTHFLPLFLFHLFLCRCFHSLSFSWDKNHCVFSSLTHSPFTEPHLHLWTSNEGEWRLSWRTTTKLVCFFSVLVHFQSQNFETSLLLVMALSMHKDSSNSMDSSKYVRYTPEQVEALERVYAECPKPSSLRRQQLIRECPILSNIEPKQIKVWFQNRR